MVIEILSPANEKLDRHTKLKYYAAFGVGEYWIIDYEVRILEQYARMGDTLERKGIFSEAFPPSLFSNMIINLSEIFKGPGF